MSNRPFLSVIVPVYNGGRHLPLVLSAIADSRVEGIELVVVDDCSTDESPLVARSFDAVVVKTGRRSGPAEARNLGVRHAAGDLLCFVDADCLVRPDTLLRLSSFLRENPGIDAVFGTYDDSPATANWVGRYKNLYLHHVYQNAGEQTRIFSTACGCVRRDAYDAVEGFKEPYRYMPGMQDVEFGYRLNEAGFKSRILKDVQVCHLKDWGWKVVKCDLVNRGIPWMKIILTKPARLENERNLSDCQRLCLVLAWLAFLATMFIPLLLNYCSIETVLAVLLAVHGALAYLNRDLLALMYRRFGTVFAIFSYFVHYVYFLNCGVSIFLGTLVYYVERNALRAGRDSTAKPKNASAS